VSCDEAPAMAVKSDAIDMTKAFRANQYARCNIVRY